MTIAQRTQLAALRAMRNHPELGKTNEDRRLPTALGSLSEARAATPVETTPKATPAEPRRETTDKGCPMALKLLLEG